MTQKKHLNTINQKAKIYLTKKICFSLVELTIILAILSVLCSLLMPSLNKVMDNQYTILCANNLKGINLALEGFLNDNDDQYPMPDDEMVTWDDHLGTYDGRNKAPKLNQHPETYGFDVNKYPPGTFEIYHCPKDPAHSTTNNRATRSYTANESQPHNIISEKKRGIMSDVNEWRDRNNKPKKRWSMHRFMVNQPSATIALTEISPYKGRDHDLGNNSEDTVIPSRVRESFWDRGIFKHGGEAFMQNYLMVDGCIKTLNIKDTFGDADKDILTLSDDDINKTEGTLWDARK